MTRTEAIRAAIEAELKRHRETLDGNVALESVTLTVRMDVRRGLARKVIMAQESVREL